MKRVVCYICRFLLYHICGLVVCYDDSGTTERTRHGSYFHVIERKVGGNLDAFRRELGRLRESGHFHRDRHERIMRIAQTVGFGHIVRQCLVDTGHRAGCEVHVLTSTGIVLVFNAHSCKLVTVLVARPGQVARYYEPFGEDVPDWLMNRAYENTCVRHLNY